MKIYESRPYRGNKWVVVEAKSGREIILFNKKEQAEEACRQLNEE